MKRRGLQRDGGASSAVLEECKMKNAKCKVQNEHRHFFSLHFSFSFFTLHYTPIARLADHLRGDALHVNRRGGASATGRPLKEHLLQRDVLGAVWPVTRRRPRAVQADARRADRRREMQRAGVGPDEQRRSPANCGQLGQRRRRRSVNRRARRVGDLLGHRPLARAGPNDQRRQMPSVAQMTRHGRIAIGGPQFRRPARSRIDDRKPGGESQLADDPLGLGAVRLMLRHLKSNCRRLEFQEAAAIPGSNRPRGLP